MNQEDINALRNMKPINKLSIKEILDYEINSSWTAGFIWFNWGREIIGSYFARKVKRKHKRYSKSLDSRNKILKREEEKKSDLLKNVDNFFNNITEEQRQRAIEYFKDDRPKGWLSIEEYLPMMPVDDLVQGYSVFKVRDKDGKEFETRVTDHHIWYYHAKDAGVTHWLND